MLSRASIIKILTNRSQIMANFSIIKLDDKVLEKLRKRASQHGVFIEEEVRRIIEQAVSNPVRLGDLGDIALQYFGKEQGQNLQISDHKPHQLLQL